jgi:8-hydroxy-5-deazaflavin:NADPH oxidoreductase
MKIGILGSAVVAKTLGEGFLQHGHAVMLGSRSPEKLKEWVGQNPGSSCGTFAEAAAFGELVVLAVKGPAAVEALQQAGPANLIGKPVLDATNPIADAPPVNGVLQFFTDMNHSLMETLQETVPAAHFVKAFNSVGQAGMVHPKFAGGPPSMFICGNDAGAKKTVSALIEQLGWQVEDMGAVEAARAIEPLCILWCIPGFAKNDWMHAFKMLR